MSSQPLLATKISLPRARSDWVPRPKLIKKLEQNPDQKLVLVAAPAGYGKTSLIASWAATTKRKVAWISLGPGENDISRFMRYLMAATASQLPTNSQTNTAAMHFLGWESIEYGLTALLNQVQAQDSSISLVLDDLHHLDNPRIYKALEFLIIHLPAELSVVLITRKDPPLSLAMLRGKGRLLEVRSSDLSFSRQETELFLTNTAPELFSNSLIEDIHSKTEGWITGIRLFTTALQQYPDSSDIPRALSGNIKEVSDYLFSEVIEKLPSGVQEFLAKTSLLERFSAPLCNQLLGISNSKQKLADLAKQNLFLEHLDHSGTWFRYHGLFQEALQSRLTQSDPETISTLHQRASSWFSAAGEFDQAIYHAHQATDDLGAAALLDRHIDDLWEKGEFTTILKWAQKIDPAVFSDRTQLSVYLSLALVFTGDLHQGIQRLQQLDNQTSSESMEGAQGWLAAAKTYIAYFQRDIPEIIPAAEQALALLPDQDHTWRGGIAIILSNAYIHLGDFPQAAASLEEAYRSALITGNSFQLLTTRLHQAILNVYQGKMHRAISIIETVLADDEINRIPAAGVLYAVWADILREQNKIREAEQKLETGNELGSVGSGGAAARAWTKLVSIKISHSKNDLEAMQKAIQDLEQLSTETSVPDWVPVLENSWKIRYQLLKDNYLAAERLLTAWGERLQMTSPFLELEFKIARARVEIFKLETKFQIQAAENLIDQLTELERITSSKGWLEKQLTILLFMAKVYAISDRNEQAFDSLHKALSLAEPECFTRIFLEEGNQVKKLIQAAAARQDLPRYAEVLKQAITGEGPRHPGGPLSERELEILALVAEGLSNREIGEKLYITTGTVKVHTNHIFQKLGVSNRTQAVTWAREIGILP